MQRKVLKRGRSTGSVESGVLPCYHHCNMRRWQLRARGTIRRLESETAEGIRYRLHGQRLARRREFLFRGMDDVLVKPGDEATAEKARPWLRSRCAGGRLDRVGKPSDMGTGRRRATCYRSAARIWCDEAASAASCEIFATNDERPPRSSNLGQKDLPRSRERPPIKGQQGRSVVGCSVCSDRAPKPQQEDWETVREMGAFYEEWIRLKAIRFL